MLRLFKVLTCDHHWCEVEQKMAWSNCVTIILVKVYCPKCKRLKDVTLDEWDRHLKIREIDNIYEFYCKNKEEGNDDNRTRN